ncbi:ABC transporter ATP-binding protein [Tissierella praeacuta]|uniref:ABC transporter ATP-binding protein n=1 Tax=Tissierella praeacuta TaxID=43131 RepID=UPI001C10EE56|nr:oligopeptide/dipeptide ABC transporter ATP-binding protein [Tissierella praeacuta]MBU5255426.1 ATP-binding cassette domain-containing protein [Tissierella praeacuta]
MENREKEKLIEVNNLKKYFPVKSSSLLRKVQYLKAVDDVSFYINEGETLGLVGESGCGKSTTGRSIIRLFDITDGEILYRGKDIAKLKESDLRFYRRKMQVIFQDPYSSLNPTLTVKDIISEPLDVYHIGTKKERQERTLELLEKVGLGRSHLDRYPHEFSGGQRQRIGIARALSINPEFILCDEPISALDVSIQAQVVNMLEDLQNEMGLTYLFIAHDLSMVRHISHRIGVMYLGKLIEIGKSDEIYNNSLHPYTQALLSSALEPDPRIVRENPIKVLEGDVPSPLNPPLGCKFVTRCKYAMKQCYEIEPELIEKGTGHMVACHLS